MDYQKITASNGSDMAKILPSFKQLLPFSPIHTAAQETFLQGLTKYDQELSAQFSLMNGGRLVALISYKKQDEGIYITNILLSPAGFQLKKGLGFWLEELEKQGKLLGAQRLVLPLCLLDITLPDRLASFGYQVNFETNAQILAEKALMYRTGLVLAGGGARGAYQIGVWRALRELGIYFEIVAGTSVGALNGALMVQDDYQVAETMWEEIETGKILSYPHVGEADQQDSRQVLKEIQQFAQSAILHQGVSTKPLAQMIDRLLNGEKMRASSKELYICTTEFPSLKEIVVSVDEVEPAEFSRWLLASSSFFPAMAATKIGANYYVDGGYRNNIPIDVALKAGATELIMVNVKGPGITKPTKLPTNFPLRIIASPWGLGTVLFFDGSRSQWNIKLGYAETLKSFGHYRGYWYTYSGDFNQRDFQQRVAQDLQDFKTSLMEAELAVLFKAEVVANLTRKVSRLYQERLTEEGVYLYLLELAAKELKVDPTVCYDFADFLTAIKAQLVKRQRVSREKENDEQASTTWVKERSVDFTLPLETQPIPNLVTAIKELAITQSQLLALAKISPLNYLVAKLLVHLEQQRA